MTPVIGGIDMRRMTWNQMVEAYPNMWVAIRNPIMDGDHPDILEGDVYQAT